MDESVVDAGEQPRTRNPMPDEDRRRLVGRLARAALVAPAVTVLTEAAPNPALAGD